MSRKKAARKCGVYQIRNIINEKRYIGSSRWVENRWNNHRTMLSKGTHHKSKTTGRVSHLQNAWNRYGEKSFVFEIIEECEIEQLNARETYWFLQVPKEERYNGTDVGITTIGYKHSEETKRILSEKAKLPRLTKRKSVEQVALDGTIVSEYESIGIAQLRTGLNQAKIGACCRGERITHGGYFWQFINSPLAEGKLQAGSKFKPKCQCTMQGEIIRIYNSANELREAGFRLANVNAVCLGFRSHYKGFFWKIN